MILTCSGVQVFLTICPPFLSYFTNIITGLLLGGGQVRYTLIMEQELL